MDTPKKHNKLIGFTGILALAADIAGLVGFASGFLQADMHNFFLHPALWIVVQGSLTLYGNIAFCYVRIARLNKIYKPRGYYEPLDVKRFLLLFSYLLWIPTYLVWLVSAVLIGGTENGLAFLYVVLSIASLGWGGYAIAVWAALISRTLNPEFLVQIYPAEDRRKTVYDDEMFEPAEDDTGAAEFSDELTDDLERL